MYEWIRINRSILNLNWLDKPEMLAVFIHLLNCANEEDTQWDIKVRRGQLKTSLNILTDFTSLSKKTIRTCLSKLKEWGLIELQTCNRYTIITICNYESYFEKSAFAQMENIKGEPIKTTEEKPKKTKEELILDTEKRKKKFYQELVPYVETYGKNMIRQFFDYWAETNKSGSRMRFEQERTWCLNLRLQRWGRQQDGYKEKQPLSILHNTENKNYTEGGW